MSIDRRIEIDRLLMQALDLDGAERLIFVNAIEDAALRAEVEQMLALCESDTDPLALDAAVAARLIDAAGMSDAPALAASLGLEEAVLPEQIGAWRILERIGQGGMGEVLKVERHQAGFEQLGALKLIRSGFAIGEFARRFLQERQILARLNHPGIASLLDGGRDAQGHPFLVMEYVDGVPIDRYCDERRLGVDARIELFIEVGRAVAHAHRSLVIHRDLKPSNILVRPDGRVKLLDFGIAKVLGDAEGLDPLATRIEQRMFTPDYASPEQVRGQPVTTASDVYQLGLLLYELLCGHRAQRVGNTGPAAIERIVCEQDPTRPSQRIATSDAELAARRHLQPSQLRRRLRGDLDTIVGKALQKSPERRYGTVDELIDDLIRSRQGRTLNARPDTWRYRMTRFAHRHPIGLGFATLTFVLLGTYLVTLNLQAQALERERDRAQAEAAKARQVQSLVQRLFEGIDPDVSGGEPLSVHELLDRSFSQIEASLDAHPEVQAELLLTVGDVYQALGDYARAAELLDQAQTLAQALEAEQPLLAARVYRSRGRLLGQGNELDEPEALLQRALTLLRAAQPQEPMQVADTLYQLAEVLRRRGKTEAAHAASAESLRLRRALGASHELDQASSLNQLTMIERSVGLTEHAEDQLRESVRLMATHLPPLHPLLAESKAELAMVLRNKGALSAAQDLYREAIEALRISRGENHPDLGIVLGNLGGVLAELGRHVEAEGVHRDALAIHRNSFGEQHARVALTHNAIGFSLRAQGRLREADDAFRAAIESLPKSHAPWARSFHQNRGIALLELGRSSEALEELRKAADLTADSATLQRASLNRWFADAWLQNQDPAQAENHANEAIRLFEATDRTRVELADAYRLRGLSRRALQRHADAVTDLARALELHADRALPSSPALDQLRAELDATARLLNR